MKIDKNALAALASLGDRELWEAIGKIASEHGFSLPKSTPNHEEMEKLRSVISGSDKINMREAIKLLNSYKKRN